MSKRTAESITATIREFVHAHGPVAFGTVWAHVRERFPRATAFRISRSLRDLMGLHMVERYDRLSTGRYRFQVVR